MSAPMTESSEAQELKRLIREIPDFPKPGILFYDITTLLKDAQGLATVIEGLQSGVNPAMNYPYNLHR